MKLTNKISLAFFAVLGSFSLSSCMSSLTLHGQLPFFIDYELEFDNDSDYNDGRYDDGQYHDEYDHYEDRYDDGQYHGDYNNDYNNNYNGNFEYILANRTWYSQGPFSSNSNFYTSNLVFKINPNIKKIMIQKDYYINNRYYDTFRIVYNYSISGNWDNKTHVKLHNPQIFDLSGKHIKERAIPQNIMDRDINKYNPVGFDISYLPNGFVINDQPNSGIVYTFK